MKRAVFFAIAAAALYALNSPVSKLFLSDVPAAMMSAFLYLGAGLFTGGVLLYRRIAGKKSLLPKFGRKDVLPLALMVLLDIAGMILFMKGLALASPQNAALLNNFEIVVTSVAARVVFREKISGKMWTALLLIIFSSILLSFEGEASLDFSIGSLFLLAGCTCWGFENNITRKLADKDNISLVFIDGVGSGSGALITALLIGESFPDIGIIPLILLLGAVAFGMSICLYVAAQRTLGAAATSAYYAVGPFIGAILSFIIFRQLPSLTFIIAFVIMALGMCVASFGLKKHKGELK